jgi:hypothetical protein
MEQSDGRQYLWHQRSQDNGITWENATNISTLNAELISVSAAADSASNIHLVQLTKDYTKNYSIQHWKWQGQRWAPEEGLEIGTDFTASKESIDSVTNPDGYLAVLYSGTNLAEDADNPENDLFFTSRSIELDEIEPLIVSLTQIPTSTPTAFFTEEQPISSTNTPTATLSIQSIKIPGPGSQADNNNPWSGLVIGGTFGAAVLAIFFGLILFRQMKK